MEADETQEVMGEENAVRALNEIAGAKAKVAERSKAPTGYYAVLGAAVGLDIFGITQPSPQILFYVIPALMAIGLAMGWYRSSVGTWAMGKINDPRSWPFWVMSVVAVIALVVALAIHTTMAGLICGGVTFVTWAILGPVWDRAYQRQVEER